MGSSSGSVSTLRTRREKKRRAVSFAKTIVSLGGGGSKAGEGVTGEPLVCGARVSMRSQPTRNSGRETRAAKRSAFQVSVSSRNADTSANAPHGPTCAHAVSRAGTSASSPKAPKSETHSHDASDHEGATPRASNTVRVARRTCASVTSGEGGDAGASGGGGARAPTWRAWQRARRRERVQRRRLRATATAVCAARRRVCSREV